MRYFIDTEFIEGFKKPLFGKRRHFIDMISVGIVCEDGRTYEAVSSEYKWSDADDWVKENVIVPLYCSKINGDNRNHIPAESFQKVVGKNNSQIAKEICDFIDARYVDKNRPEKGSIYPGGTSVKEVKSLDVSFYGYYCDYDWVLFCSLFGRMIDLPRGFPMYCIDLKQTMDSMVMRQEQKYPGEDRLTSWLRTVKNHPAYPKQENEHSAIADALWNKKLYDFLSSYKPYSNNQPAKLINQ